MIEIVLGDRYARSIYKLANDNGEIAKVKSDFILIDEVCSQNPDFVVMLKSPLIYSDKKQEIINAIFGDKLSKITRTFLEIIIRKKREPWLRDIATRFLDLYDVQNNITRGVLSSAVSLPADFTKHLKAIIEKELNTSFVCEEKIDPELIGGFVLRVGDYQFDGSIASGLKRLKNEFDSNPYIKEL